MNNLKTKVENLGVGKLKSVPVDLKKLRDFADNEVVKNANTNRLKTKINNLDKKNSDATALIHINQFNTNKQNLEKKKIEMLRKNPDFSGLVTTIVVNKRISEVKNKILDIVSLVTTTSPNMKIGDVENKILDHTTYIATQEFIRLTAESF